MKILRSLTSSLIVSGAVISTLLPAFAQTRDSRAIIRPTQVQAIRVNSRTISQLPAGRKYLVDLTRRGVIYNFDPALGAIDFTRVSVRTKTGDLPLGYMATDDILKASFERLAIESSPNWGYARH